MKDALQTSKKQGPSGPDVNRVDGSLGFVPASEIRNVWTEANMRLDVELWPKHGPIPPRDVILEFVQDLQFKLLTRASVNLEKVIGKAVVKSREQKLDEQSEVMSQAARAAREARIAKYR